MKSVQNKSQLSRTFSSLRHALIASACIVSSSAWSAELVWTGDFETNDFSQYKNDLYGEGQYSTRKIVTSPTRGGKYAVELTVLGNERPGGRERAEIRTEMPNSGAMRFQWDGPEYWVGFSFYFKEWNAAGWTFFQIHAPDGNSGETCFMGGNAIGVYPDGEEANNGIADRLVIRAIEQGGTAKSSAGSNTTAVYGSPLTLNVWHNYVMRIKLSTRGEGYFEAWKEGVKVYSKFNLTNVDFRNSCGNNITETSHHGAHIGTYGDNAPTFRQVYFDEVRIAEGQNGYDLVSPGSSGGGIAAAAPPSPPINLSAQ